MEPITLVFFMLGYIISRTIIRPLLARALAPDTKPATPVLEPAKKNEVYDCEVYSERLLDEKMVGAELMTLSDMAVCDNLECPNCLSSRPKPVLNQLVEHKVRNNPAQKKRLIDEAKDNMRNRGTNRYQRPENVPSYAHRYEFHNPAMLRDEIIWEWMDFPTGRVHRLRQLVTPDLEAESYALYSDQSMKPIRTFWGGDTNSTGPR